MALYTAVKSSNTVIDSTLYSWEKEFYTYQINAQGGAAASEAAWYTNLNVWLAGAGQKYRGNIKFLDDTKAGSVSNYIEAAGMNFNHRMCFDSKCQVANMQEIRATVLAVTPRLGSSPAAFPFSENYLQYEQYAVIEEEAFRNVGLSFVAIFIITFLLIPHPVVSILVFIS